jgi:hypothetical protein
MVYRWVAVYSNQPCQSFRTQSGKDYAPSMTTFKLSRSPWITFSVGPTVTRASSRVSRSNFCRMAATQISPLNLFPNFSAPLLVREDLRALSHLTLTEPFPIHLLRCHGKHREYFNHYHHHHTRHCRGQRYFLSIYTEVCEEIRDTFEEVEQCIVTCTDVNSRLTWIDVG